MKKQIKDTLPAIKNTSVLAVSGVSDESGLASYIQKIQRFPILSANQEYNFAKKWADNKDSAAAESLISSHLRLVVSVAYDLKNYGIAVSDLIASGNMGLMQALQKFDPDKGFRFSTYAMFWIRAEMYETILNNWSVVKIGTSANQKRVFFNLSRAKKALGIMDNRLSDVQTAQIAKYLQVPEIDVSRMGTRLSARDMSLNAPAHNNDDASDMLSNLPDLRDDAQARAERLEFRRRGMLLLQKHLSDLSIRDLDILRARKLQDPAATLEVLSKKHGISRERVRQIEERAYAKLRVAVLEESGK